MFCEGLGGPEGPPLIAFSFRAAALCHYINFSANIFSECNALTIWFHSSRLINFSPTCPTVKPLPLSPLELQSSTAVGGAGERQALELRVRAVEEENRALRRELSQPPRSPPARLPNGSHRGNQSRAHSEEGTGDNEGQKAAAVGNSSDCVQQPVVDKCEVRQQFKKQLL